MEGKNEEETIHEGILYAESIYGANTRKGLVKLSYGITFEIVCSPNEAREFALSVLEAAEAAESDELVMSWLRNRIGLKEVERGVEVLKDFRKMREQFKRDHFVEKQ